MFLKILESFKSLYSRSKASDLVQLVLADFLDIRCASSVFGWLCFSVSITLNDLIYKILLGELKVPVEFMVFYP